MRTKRNTKTGITRVFATMTAVAAAALFMPVPSAASDHSVASISIAERASLEHKIDAIANAVANRKRYFENDHLPIHLKSAFDVASNMLIMHADERLGPESGYVEIEQLRRDVQEAIWPLLEGFKGFEGLEWRYGGKDLYFWFPGDRRVRDQSKSTSPHAPSVLIGAGHGYYYHHGYKDWRPQRSVHHGILEDDLTTQYASVLYAQFLVHDVTSDLIRVDRFETHLPSGQPYYMVAARYQIEERLPDRPDIWHSLPGSADVRREYLEDIRSRPLYANEVGASALIHLHTNASADVSARGTKVYFQTGSAESSRLGSMVLCYMGEAIHGIERFRDFRVDGSPSSGDYGENRLATMPSVIVELGFHTNAEDAAALKDYEFMAQSMAGLAKGYRLYKEGATCTPFALKAPPTAQGFVDENVTINVSGLGYPEFPVEVRGVVKNCTQGCGIAHSLAHDAGELAALGLAYRCTKDDEGSPFVLEVTGSDMQGVKTEPVEVAVSCVQKPDPWAGKVSALLSP